MIAQTIAERLFADGRLGVSFCSCDFKNRRNPHYTFPTLALRPAHNTPNFEPSSLLSSISTAIVINPLDECFDEDPQPAALSVVGRLVEEIRNVKLITVGQSLAFSAGLLRPLTDVFVLHEVEPSVISTDIRLFLERGLSELAKRRGIELGVWPKGEYLDLLCKGAGSFFVCAAATPTPTSSVTLQR